MKFLEEAGEQDCIPTTKPPLTKQLLQEAMALDKGAARSELTENSDLWGEGDLMRSGTFFKFSGGPGPPGAPPLC